MIESLEPRRLLTATAVLEDGIVRILGTDEAEHIVIRVDDADTGPLLVVADSDTEILSVPVADVRGILAELGGGDDSLITGPRVHVPMRVLGGGGDDRIQTGSGNDLVHGGEGSDFLRASLGADEFFGGAGVDGVSYADVAHHVRVTLDDQPNDGMFRFRSATGVSPDAQVVPMSEGDNVHHDIEIVIGGQGDDYIAGVHSPRAVITPRVRFEGGPGNDVLVAGFNGEGSALIGGEGNDRLVGGPRRDLMDGGLGHDHMVGHAGADDFVGGPGGDTVDYSDRSVNLRIILDDLANDGAVLENDNVHSDVERVLGGRGNDHISVGPILPTLEAVAEHGPVIFEGGPGDDLLNATPPARTLATRTPAAVSTTQVTPQLAPDAAPRAFAVLIGGLGNDRLIGSARADRLLGGPGDDYLQGNDGPDLLDGGAGRDALHGGAGNDLLIGNDGEADLLDGGADEDTARADLIDTLVDVEHVGP